MFGFTLNRTHLVSHISYWIGGSGHVGPIKFQHMSRFTVAEHPGIWIWCHSLWAVWCLHTNGCFNMSFLFFIKGNDVVLITGLRATCLMKTAVSVVFRVFFRIARLNVGGSNHAAYACGEYLTGAAFPPNTVFAQQEEKTNKSCLSAGIIYIVKWH